MDKKKQRVPVEWCSICKYAKSHPQFDCLSQSNLTGFTADDCCHNFEYDDRTDVNMKLPELPKHIPKPPKRRNVDYPKTTITIPRKKVVFEFEVGVNWEPQSTNCHEDCPFFLPTTASTKCSFMLNHMCPFTKNLTISEDCTKVESCCEKTGKWLDIGHDGTCYTYVCSNCGYMERDNMTKHNTYCPACGAYMLKED